MDKHEEKYCPKCGDPFTCKLGDIANCQCATIELSGEATDFLTKTFFDCLCKDCLVKINNDVKFRGLTGSLHRKKCSLRGYIIIRKMAFGFLQNCITCSGDFAVKTGAGIACMGLKIKWCIYS